MTQLPTARAGLLSHPLDGQVLVYDTRGDRVHLLDPTTACVLELLQEGGRTEDDVSLEISTRLGQPAHSGYLQLAIDQLYSAGLLDERATPVAPLPDLTRRDVVRSLAAAGVMALAIPTITSLTATIASAQPGQSFRGVGQACGGVALCSPDLDCCAGICRDGACNGQPCSVPGDCFSTNCCTGFCSATVCAGSLPLCAPCSPAGTNAACTNGTCNNQGACTNTQSKNATGASCNNNNNCCSNLCSGGFCT